MKNNEKRSYREIKRQKKKAGNRDVRNYLKRQLRDNPEEAHWDDYDFGNNSTEDMNGKYKDSTRRIDDYERDDNYPDEDRDRY